MTLDELKEKWDLDVVNEGIRRTAEGKVNSYTMRVRGVGIGMDISVPEGRFFSWEDFVYSISFDLKALSDPGLTYTQFCQVTGRNSRLEATKLEYGRLSRYFIQLREVFPAEFLEDMRRLMRGDV